jgi:hypothetical protein
MGDQQCSTPEAGFYFASLCHLAWLQPHDDDDDVVPGRRIT